MVDQLLGRKVVGGEDTAGLGQVEDPLAQGVFARRLAARCLEAPAGQVVQSKGFRKGVAAFVRPAQSPDGIPDERVVGKVVGEKFARSRLAATDLIVAHLEDRLAKVAR